jgi:uncharacterized OsmC-like protein/esterase/lipase
MRTEDIRFPGSQVELAGRLSFPDGDINSVAVFAHCFTCSQDIPAVTRITSSLSNHGVAVMSFDFTGLGHSHGEFSDTNFSTNVVDVQKAIEHLRSLGLMPTLLIGHSLGGAAVLQVASKLDEIEAVVTIGAPSGPQHLEGLLADSVAEIEHKGQATVTLANRDFVFKDQFLRDIESSDILSCVNRMRAALLVMHSPLDNTVGIENAEEIFDAAKHPKSFVSLDDADHLLRRVKDSEYVAEMIVSWASRYVTAAEHTSGPEAGDGSIVVSEVSADGFQQDILIGSKHALLADEPEDFGGQDTGPTPYQLVAAGLGACTSMTLRMYAKRKQIPLSHVSVEVTHDKRHAEVEPDTSLTHDHFVRRIRLTGTLTSEQRQSLLAVADKCPVHKTLESTAHIETIDVSADAAASGH